MQPQVGSLFVVASPIGHLGDITYRAVALLRGVDWIAVEDSRRSLILLQHYGIERPMLPYHAHNEQQMAPRLLKRLQQGEQGALLSDAGTPLIQDPGFTLVRQCQEASIPVRVLPGPCAAVAALSGAGIEAAPFWFEGFLPSAAAPRAKRLQALQSVEATLVFYEAPHRLRHFLESAIAVLGSSRQIVVARELTKRWEHFYRGRLEELLAQVGDTLPERGELVLMLQGAQASTTLCAPAEETYQALRAQLPLREAVRLTAQIYTLPKNEVYRYALQQEQV